MITWSEYWRGGPVVEIGSGHRPQPYADVLVDKYLDPREREGALALDGRPLVVADVQDLPFVDEAFGYSICCHVVEHAPDIARALDEIQRVSRAGYLETPSALYELLEPHRDYHRWLLARHGDGLEIWPKPPGPHPRHALLDGLTRHNLSFKLFNATNPGLRATVLRWRDRIPYRVADTPFAVDELAAEVTQGGRDLLLALARQARDRGQRALAGAARRVRRRVDLAPLVRCARCHGPLRILSARVICDACQGSYPRQGALFFLGAEHFEPGLD